MSDLLHLATERNRELETRWVSIFTHLAKQTGESIDAMVLDLGEEGEKAVVSARQTLLEHPQVLLSPLYFLQFPSFVKLATRRADDLRKIGSPAHDWLKQVNKLTEPLTRYRNHLFHVDRFSWLPQNEKTKAIQLYEEHIGLLKTWFPSAPLLTPRPPVPQTGIRAALAVLDRDERSAVALAHELGFEAKKQPTNLVDEGIHNSVKTALGDLVPRLYRVGDKQVGGGAVALFVAYIKEWPERSSERERYRRRIASALVRYRSDLNASRCLVIMLDDSADREQHASSGRGYEAELIYPSEKVDGSGVRTVRATIDLLDPTRYHVELLQSLSIKGLNSVKDVVKRWSEAFSVEAVTKTFFAELRDVRDAIAEAFIASNPDHPVLGGYRVADFKVKWADASPAQREMQTTLRALATRLVSRMLFLWFLQAKGWLGSPMADGSRTFMVDLFRKKPQGVDTYFSQVLTPLFFDGLGAPVKTEAHKECCDVLTGMMGKLIKEGSVAVPYLNGGLFRADGDPFEASLYRIDEDNVRTLDVKLPDTLFADHEPDILQGTGKKGQPRARTVLGLLNRYRFTTQESTPDDQSVDPDPELLGRVFEDLYQSDERHQTGAYYTPREIVRYMCRKALDGYLRDLTGIGQETIDQLRAEAADWEASTVRLSMSDEKALNLALDEVTVVDPAVGSGAFLVGMLQEVVLLRRGIHAAQSDSTIGSTTRRVHDWKRWAITHNLHGVDINPTAVEICRLRLWLSLLIDYAPERLEDISALPNLEFRVVAGDSLVDRMGAEAFPDSLPRNYAQASFETEKIYRQIGELERKFTDADERGDSKRVRGIATDLRELRLKVARQQVDDAIERSEAARDRLLRGKPAKKVLTDAENAVRNLHDLRDGLREDAPFQKPLLWPLAFPQVFDNGGFDIVLANPPYVRQESLSALDQQVYEKSFGDFATGTADLYVMFFARALQVMKDGGWLAFITSNKYMRADYGRKLRTELPARTTIEEVIDFGDLPVFEVAAYPAVVVARKGAPADENPVTVADLTVPIRKRLEADGLRVNADGVRQALGGLERLVEETAPVGFGQPLLRGEGWILEDPALIRLFNRLMNEGTPLGEYVQGRMYYGIKTGLNEAFVIDQATRDALVAADPNSAELIKPWLRGRDIKRWKAEWAGLYLIFTRRGIDINAYPAIKEHLSAWREELEPKKESSTAGSKGRKPGTYKWYEIQDPVAYYREFESPKLLWPRNIPGWETRFCIDSSGSYINDKAYMLGTNSRELVQYLNAPIILWMLDSMTTKLRGGYIELKMDEVVGKLPVPRLIHTAASSDPTDLHAASVRSLGCTDEEATLVWDWYMSRAKGDLEENEPDDDR